MAERRATNKYYPPDWDPSKGSVNRHKKSHPLRDRAKKIDQGILVVRFEMPYNVWCLKCNNHIGTGVRYNAEKSKIGNYYTSPIYQFKMKCHLCDNFFVIKTDPAKFDYVITEGAKKRAMPSDEAGETSLDDRDLAGLSALDRAEEAKRRLYDSMHKLEKKTEAKLNAELNEPNLRDIIRWSDSRWKDSFSSNQLIRAQFRKKRKSIEQAKERDRRLLKRASLGISLVESSSTDRERAEKIVREAKADRVRQAETRKRKEILETNKFIVPSKYGRRLESTSPLEGTRSRVVQKITNLK